MPNLGHAIRAAGLGLAIYACSAATEGKAADMPFFGGEDPTPQTKVEFGTGWYIRGDASWVQDKGAVGTTDLSSLINQVKTNWSADVGAGYKFNNWFRSDLTLGKWGQQGLTGPGAQVNCPSEIRGLYSNDGKQTPIGVWAVPNGCTPIEQANLNKYALLLNGYVDLGTWYGVTPFLGAGIGGSRVSEQVSVNYFNSSNGSPYAATLTVPGGYPAVYYSTPDGYGNQYILNPQPVYNYGTQNWNRSYNIVKYNFAWALMAGVSYSLTENASLELGYRYVNFGSLNGTSLSAQEVRLGIRYLIDGMM